MIYIGYQGIGKSTLSCREKGFIDFESSNFRANGVRPQNWELMYCQAVFDLASQGYDVFTSSHQGIRDLLGKMDPSVVMIIHPDLTIKDDWIKKLEERYTNTNLDKDYRALMNAKDRYTENIQELMDDAEKYNFGEISVTSTNYNLERLISSYKHFPDILPEFGGMKIR